MRYISLFYMKKIVKCKNCNKQWYQDNDYSEHRIDKKIIWICPNCTTAYPEKSIKTRRNSLKKAFGLIRKVRVDKRSLEHKRLVTRRRVKRYRNKLK